MRHKSEAFEKFKELKAEMKNHRGKSIKSLRSDRRDEYLLGEFKQFFEDHGITSQLAAPSQPQQNDVAERRNQTLLEMVRSMMSYASLPNSFWGYALKTSQYILNLVSSKAIPTTPKELWTGRKPSLGHVWIWGNPAHVLKRDPSKLEAMTDVCLFVGYPKGTKDYLFYNP